MPAILSVAKAVTSDYPPSMGLDAVALIKIDFPKFIDAFAAVETTEDLTILTGANGSDFGVKNLNGGTAVYTGLPFSTDAADVAISVRYALGDLLDEHADARGLLIFPTAANPAPSSWDDLVSELGEGADWTALPRASDIPSQFSDAPEGGLADLMGQVMQMMGPEVGRLAQAVTSGDADALSQAAEGIQTQLQGSGETDALTAAFGQFMGGAPDAGAGGLDLAALMEQAGALAAANPGLVDSIRSEMGGAKDAAPVDGEALKEMIEQVTGKKNEDS